MEVRSAKFAAPVSRTTLRTRDRGAMGFLVTITTSRHSGIASSSATAAPPTCPVPPRIIAAKVCFITELSLGTDAAMREGLDLCDENNRQSRSDHTASDQQPTVEGGSAAST